MKILHCLTTLNFGGIERIVPACLPTLKQMYPNMTQVLCAFQTGKNTEHTTRLLESSEIPLYVLDKQGKIDFRFCKAFKKLVKYEKPDIIHAYDSTSMLWARCLFGKDRSIYIICHCGGISEITVFQRRLKELLLCNRTDRFVFVSESTKKVWNSYLNIKCLQHVVYNGIDLASFESKTHNDNVSSGARPISPFNLLIVGRIVPQKAIHTILYALKILKDRGQTDIQLYLVGDGNATKELCELADSLQIGSMLRFEGYKADVQSYYERAHVAICTSYNETFCLSLAEAMYNRVVCISANVGGPSEFIKDSVNGFLLDSTEKPSRQQRRRCTSRVYNAHFDQMMEPLEIKPEVLADCIADVRSKYAELEQLRDNARRTIKEKFSMKNYCAGLREVYFDIAKKLL